MVLKNIRAVNYLISGVGFQIRCSPKGLIGYIDSLFARYNFISPAADLKPRVILSIRIVSNPSFRIIQKAKLILRFHTCGFRVYKKGDYLFFTDNSNLLILQPGHRKGILIIKKQDNLNLPEILNNFVISAIIELLSHQNYFYLHAAGVTKNGCAVLLVADNGQGKSTNALRLFSEGWKYLCDDLVLLRRNNKQQVRALSLTYELKFKKQNPILKKKKFYFLRKLFRRNAKREGLYKINMASVAPDKVVGSFIPNLILFFRISHSKFSLFKPIENSEALLFLIKQSKHIFLGRNITNDNVGILIDLISQARNYVLEIGKDIQEDKVSLSNLISHLTGPSQVGKKILLSK